MRYFFFFLIMMIFFFFVETMEFGGWEELPGVVRTHVKIHTRQYCGIPFIVKEQLQKA